MWDDGFESAELLKVLDDDDDDGDQDQKQLKKEMMMTREWMQHWLAREWSHEIRNTNQPGETKGKVT